MQKILVVDDEDNIRLLYQEELRDEGYEVALAGGAEEAFQKIEEDPPDLITLDVKMPGMNGIEFLEKIRASEKFHDSIVFILTTSTDDQDKFEAYNLNVAGYMLKSDMGTSFIRAIEMVEQYWKVVEFPVAAM